MAIPSPISRDTGTNGARERAGQSIWLHSQGKSSPLYLVEAWSDMVKLATCLGTERRSIAMISSSSRTPSARPASMPSHTRTTTRLLVQLVRETCATFRWSTTTPVHKALD